MLRKILSIFLFLFVSAISRAQDTPSEFATKQNQVFQHLNRTEATTGILLDYGLEFLNLQNYTGANLLDSNFLNISEWRSIYSSLLVSQYNGSVSFLSPQALNAKINSAIDEELPVPLLGYD
ncbi:hypothetical protein EZ449_12270 [Pedobacter frigidisoli]|uniref:Uncharacterized protein n=1 Tax=Pedobacter frigidisoli TaxID=2530455 RepID=A0A4R0P486_9SPHI|nr:hypothetical protein [Pedobacter frigidisoli]TCD08608.1 hypothetical protein EZ449_12270 [Pedobacter frigidisoli]